jgi:hypothetical protein
MHQGLGFPDTGRLKILRRSSDVANCVDNLAARGDDRRD